MHEAAMTLLNGWPSQIDQAADWVHLGWLKRTPDVQQLFVNAGGTKNFSQHLALGP
jgi:hypothetical protein